MCFSSNLRRNIYYISIDYALGALGGTRTPTILLTATSRQRVYQFRHERFKEIGTGKAGPDQRRRCNKSGMEGQGLTAYRLPGDFGSICLTSTAIRLRSTSTTPLAIGRLLARILTSSASVASSSIMAPRDSRITWWMGMVGGARTTLI